MNLLNKRRAAFLSIPLLDRSGLSGVLWLMAIVMSTIFIAFNLILNGIVFSGFMPSFCAALALLGLGSWFVMRGFTHIKRKRWIVGSSIFFIVCAIGIAPVPFTRGMQQFLTRVNFFFIRDMYLDRISKIQRADQPLFVVFGLDGFDKELVIFDESDELDNSSTPRSKEWWMRAKGQEPELALCHWTSMKVAQHFYRVMISCEYPYTGSAIPHG